MKYPRCAWWLIIAKRVSRPGQFRTQEDPAMERPEPHQQLKLQRARNDQCHRSSGYCTRTCACRSTRWEGCKWRHMTALTRSLCQRSCFPVRGLRLHTIPATTSLRFGTFTRQTATRPNEPTTGTGKNYRYFTIDGRTGRQCLSQPADNDTIRSGMRGHNRQMDKTLTHQWFSASKSTRVA